MSKDHNQVWNNCLQIIKDNIPKDSYNTWFKPIVPKKLENNVLTIQVPDSFYYELLEEHYLNILSKSLKREIGPKAKLEYNIVAKMRNNGNTAQKEPLSMNTPAKDTNYQNKNNTDQNASKTREIRNPFVIPGIKEHNVDSQLNPIYSMDNFVEGACNKLARSAGITVAENPGATAFNPFVIYGAAGLGKTHLAQGIGLHAKEKYPNKSVLYVPAEKFITQFTDSIRNNNKNDFVHFYQMIDILIIDDIQDFAGREKTQNTFFHIFNHLHQLGKQLILTSDKPPAQLKELEKRLLSRFKWALIAELEPPDIETRKNIIYRKLRNNGGKMPDEVVDFIAKNVTNSIREIEGSIISLLGHSSHLQNELSVDLASEVIQRIVSKQKKEITVEYIQSVVSDYYNIEVDDLHSKSRKREIVQARQIAMYFSKHYTKLSLSAIGAKIGNKDHATVLHASRTVNNLMETDKKFRANIAEIKRLLTS